MAPKFREGTLAEVLASPGHKQPPAESPPISASDIRRFAMAVYWPNTPPRIYWDDDYAGQTKWGGIISPPEFNPFAWAISGPNFFPSDVVIVPGTRRFNAGSEVVYGEPMRSGDVITATERVAEVSEKTGRSGRLVFVISEIVWRNQRGILVKTLRFTRAIVVPEGFVE